MLVSFPFLSFLFGTFYSFAGVLLFEEEWAMDGGKEARGGMRSIGCGLCARFCLSEVFSNTLSRPVFGWDLSTLQRGCACPERYSCPLVPFRSYRAFAAPWAFSCGSIQEG